MACPTNNTCPDIDGGKEAVIEIRDTLNCILNEATDDSMRDDLHQALHSLDTLGYGESCLLEDLRDANSSIREWGEDQETEKVSLEAEIVILNNKIDDLNYDLSKSTAS